MRIVSVAGSPEAADADLDAAYRVGRLLARRGVAVACGGLRGVMEEVCRGARESGGTTIGLLPGDEAAEANPYVDVAIPTGLGENRNFLVARAGEGLIAIGAGLGTLSEMAFALKTGRRVAALGSWELGRLREGLHGLLSAGTPEEAVAHVLRER
jgi:uncharacterized protein (TIGR00725 family)